MMRTSTVNVTVLPVVTECHVAFLREQTQNRPLAGVSG